MARVNQTTSIGYQEQVYHERRTPSADASNVARWVLTPAILAFFFTGALTAGLGLAGTAVSTFGFVVGLFMFGGGLGGNAMILVRALTFDKQPAVVITERTPVAMELPEREQTIGGNRPLFVPSTSPHIVEFRGRSYDFTPRQLRLMVDRIEDGNRGIARDALEIETAVYPDVRYIMAGLEYWQERSRGSGVYEWTNAGLAWLREQMRTFDM